MNLSSVFRQRASILIFAAFLSICCFSLCHAEDNDALHIATARAALDQNDCQQAVNEVEGVSEGSRNTPKWLEVAGDAYTCVGNYQKAVDCYQEYDNRHPGNAKIQQALGNANYKLHQENAKAEKEAAAKIAAQKNLSGDWTDQTGNEWLIQHASGSGELTGHATNDSERFRATAVEPDDLYNKDVDFWYRTRPPQGGSCVDAEPEEFKTTAHVDLISHDDILLSFTETRCRCTSDECHMEPTPSLGLDLKRHN